MNKSKIKNLSKFLYKKRSYLLLIILIVGSVCILKYFCNKTLIEKIENFKKIPYESISLHKTLAENNREMNNINYNAQDTTSNLKKKSTNYEYNVTKEPFKNSCASNYSDTANLQADRLHNNICESRKTLQQKNRSTLDKKTNVGVPKKYQ